MEQASDSAKLRNRAYIEKNEMLSSGMYGIWKLVCRPGQSVSLIYEQLADRKTNMKHTLRAFLIPLIATLFSVGPAFAQQHHDHVALVYCAVDKNKDVRVVAADTDVIGDVGSAGKRWRSCSQVLHEVTLKGYEISHARPITYGPKTLIYSETAEEVGGQEKKFTITKGRETSETDEWGYMVFVLTKKEAAHK